jgi:hypothetical protein
MVGHQKECPRNWHRRRIASALLTLAPANPADDSENSRYHRIVSLALRLHPRQGKRFLLRCQTGEIVSTIQIAGIQKRNRLQILTRQFTSGPDAWFEAFRREADEESIPVIHRDPYLR